MYGDETILPTSFLSQTNLYTIVKKKKQSFITTRILCRLVTFGRTHVPDCEQRLGTDPYVNWGVGRLYSVKS